MKVKIEPSLKIELELDREGTEHLMRIMEFALKNMEMSAEGKDVTQWIVRELQAQLESMKSRPVIEPEA